MAKKLRRKTYCFNCGQALDTMTNYCSDCGQQNTTKNVSYRVLFKDFLDDYFTFDSRIFKSIKPLIFKPGFLTNEYNAGKRVKFIPPLRIYLIISIIFFLIPSVDEPKQKGDNEKSSTLYESKSVTDLLLSDQDTSRSAEIGKKTRSSHISFTGDRGLNLDFSDLDKDKLSDKHYRDSIVNIVIESLHLERGTFLANLTERGIKNLLSTVADGGKKFVSDLATNIPKTMFFLLPLFALLLKLFYIGLKPLYVECTIFSLHFHSFAFLIFILQALLRVAGVIDDLFEALGFLIICVYLVIALKKVFRQKYFLTILKFSGLGFVYSLCLALFFTITFLITLLMY